jgi:hypothetical protein
VLAGVSASDARKASILAAAAIAGVKVKQLAFALDAISATVACESAFAKMQLDSELGACDATVAASGRRRLAAASYDVEVTVNPEDVDDAALVATLAAEGISATATEADPIEELATISGVDATLLAAFESDAAVAASLAASASPPPPPGSTPPPAPAPPVPPPPQVLVEDSSPAVRARAWTPVIALACALALAAAAE